MLPFIVPALLTQRRRVAASQAIVAPNTLLIVSGQSNSRAAGVTGAADVPAAWTALSTADKARVKTWDHANTQWVNYDPATNPELLAVLFNNVSQQKWGPEVTFAVQWLAERPTGTLYLVKLGINGTGLDASIVQPRWNPSDGNLYNALKTYSTAARANLDGASVSYDTCTFWMQGEADATPATGSPTGTAFTPTTNYQSNLTALMSSTRTDWAGGKTNTFVVGRIQALDYPNTLSLADTTNNRVDAAYAVRQAQRAAVAATSGAVIIDLDTGLGGQPVLHPSAAWVQDMGQRVYAAYKRTYPGTYGDINDSTPDAFTIPAKSDQTASTVVASDVVTITGLKVRAPISVSGLEYRILLADNTIIVGNTQTVYQDWGTAAGFIENGQKLQVRLTSNAAAGGTASGTATIGGVTATYTVTTTTVTSLPGNTKSNALESRMAAVGAAAFSVPQHNAVVNFYASIGSLIDSGKIKALAIPSVHDELLARIRWDDQTTLGTKTGTMLWNTATGYSPGGASNTFIDYGYNTGSVSQNGLGIGVYIKALTANTNLDVQLNTTPSGLRLTDGGSGNVTARASLNGPNANKTYTFAPGLIAAQRVSASAVRFYSGGTPVSGDVASTSTTTTNTLLRLGGAGTSDRRIGALVVTDGFADADWSTFNSALVTLLTAFGSN